MVNSNGNGSHDCVVDFLNRYGAKTSISDLLDFAEKKSLGQIIDMKKADFQRSSDKARRGKVKKDKPFDYKLETEHLISVISETIKDNRLYKNSKITIGLKIKSNNFEINKSIKL